MKLRYFSIIPLLVLVGCTSNKVNYTRLKVYQDVKYYFNYGTHTYFVFNDDYETKVGECPIDKLYYVYNLSNDMPRISNEYFVETQELFVYDHK